MIRFKLDASALLQWLNRLEQKPDMVRKVTADALNEVGGNAVTRMVHNLSAETGVAEHWLRERVTVTEATPRNLEYRIDATRAFSESPVFPNLPGRREFVRRPDDYFHQNELVNVVGVDDEKQCPICQGIIEEGPYSIDDVREMSRRLNPYGQGLFHINCRCGVQPYRMRRELPVQFRRGNERFVDDRLTFNELVQKIRENAVAVFRAK